jgi:hypothetical protein
MEYSPGLERQTPQKGCDDRPPSRSRWRDSLAIPEISGTESYANGRERRQSVLRTMDKLNESLLSDPHICPWLEGAKDSQGKAAFPRSTDDKSSWRK